MFLEKTEYYNSNAPRVDGVSFARLQTEQAYVDALALQASADDITGRLPRDEQWYRNIAISAQFGNMELSMSA